MEKLLLNGIVNPGLCTSERIRPFDHEMERKSEVEAVGQRQALI
jgi:hypothetical protein